MFKRFLALVSATIMLLAVFSGCTYKKADNTSSKSGADAQQSTVVSSTKAKLTFTVRDKSGKEEKFNIQTSAKTLGEALFENNLISEAEYKSGFVTVVNGIKTDYNKDKSWWCLKDAGGASTVVGINDIKIADGDSYTFEYTIG